MSENSGNPGKQIKTIAYYHLFTTLFGLLFYVLIQLSLVQGDTAVRHHVEAVVNTALGLSIYYGLSRHLPRGWKLTVLATPLSWIYGIYQLSRVYQPGSGFTASLFIFIDVAILYILFRPETLALFRIEDAAWQNLAWLKTPLLLSGVFLFSLDFIGAPGAVITALAFYFTLSLVRKKT